MSEIGKSRTNRDLLDPTTKLADERQALAEEIARRCRAVDPVQLLTVLAWENLTSSGHDQLPIMLEYVHHLVVTAPPREIEGYESLSQDEFRFLHAGLRRLVELSTAAPEVEVLKEGLHQVASSLKNNSIYIRGNSFPLFQLDYIDGLAQLLDDWLLDHMGFEASVVREALLWIPNELQPDYGELQAELGDALDIEHAFCRVLKTPLFRLPSSPAEFLPFFEALTAAPCSNHEDAFFFPGSGRAISCDYPLLEEGASFYCFSWQTLIDEMPRIIDGWVREKDTKRYDSFTKSREKYATGVALSALAESLPGAQTCQNVFYPSSAGQRESDGILLYDEVVIVVEVKGGWLTPLARTGHSARLERDYGKLIGKAFRQSSSVAEYIRTTEKPTFTDSKGKPCLEMQRGPWQIYHIVLSLDDVGPLGVHLSRAQEAGLLPTSSDLPWIVTLGYLQAVTHILDSPSLFLFYLESRLRFEVYGDFLQAQSELDLLGSFLVFGYLPDFTREDRAVFFHNYDLVPMSEYFGARLAETPLPPKPSVNMDLDALRLMEEIEVSDLPGRFTLINHVFCNVPPERQKMLEKLGWLQGRLKQRQIPQCISIVRDGVGATLWLTETYLPSDRGQFAHEDSCRKYEQKADQWLTAVFIVADGGRRLVDLIFHDEPWAEDGRMAEQVESFRRSRFLARAAGSKIGRNDLCPCGSGTKYKKCCGRWRVGREIPGIDQP